MPRVRTLLVAALAGLGLAADPAHAQVAPQVIRIADGAVAAFGPLTDEDFSLEAATAAFGAPQTDPARYTVCRAAWPALGLQALFADFGGGEACDPASGKLQRAVVRAPSFRTARGVQVGTTLRDLRRVHPRTRRSRGDYVLYTQPCRFGDCPSARVPFVTARVRGGVVTALIVFVGAAGE